MVGWLAAFFGLHSVIAYILKYLLLEYDPHCCTMLQLCIKLVSPLLKQSLQVCLPALQQVYKLEQIRQSPIFVYFVFQLQLKNVINDYELIVDC